MFQLKSIHQETKFFIGLLFSMICGYSSLACTCVYEPVFCRAVNENHTIIRAVVTEHTNNHLMKVDVLDNLHQNVNEETIFVFGNNDASCAEYLAHFEVSDTVILALGSEFEYNGINCWFLQGQCGLNFLKIENDMVVGQITETMVEQPFEEFSNSILECLDYQVSTENKLKEMELNLSPNPFEDELTIKVEEVGNWEIEISNLKGQKVHSTNRHIMETTKINLNRLQNGVYFIVINNGQKFYRRKIIKG